MRPVFLLSMYLLFVVAAIAAEDAEDLQRSVHALTRQLADDRLAVREAAERQLMEIGPAALSYLPRPDEQMPAEILRRLKRVQQQLQLQKSQAAALGKLLSIQATAQPLSRVLAELERRSGNQIVDFRQRRGQSKIELPVTIDLQDVTFWEALDHILDEAGMVVYPYAHDARGNSLRAVAFIAGNSVTATRSRRTYYHSGFRFEPLRVIAERNYRESAANELEIYFQIAWEPRLTPIRLVLLRNTIRAVDQQGRLLKQTTGGESEIATGRGAATCILPFQLPGHDVHQIKKLTGELKALLPGSIETFRFDRLTSIADGGTQIQKAAATVTLESVRRDGPKWDLRIQVQFEDAAGSLESHLSGWALRNDAYLENTQGKKIEPISVEETREQQDDFGMAFQFRLEDEIQNYTFVYKTPTALLERRIPFELSNLPLP
jgi:hypothetical protein